MTDTNYINGSAALKSFIQGIHQRVDELLDERGINASGRLKRSTRTEVRETFAASAATLSAPAYWREGGGSGSPPGTKADINALQRWAIDKGLAKNERSALRIAWLTQQKILSAGSYRYRHGQRNVYTQAVEEAQSRIPAVLRAFLRDADSRHRKEFIQSFNAA